MYNLSENKHVLHDIVIDILYPYITNSSYSLEKGIILKKIPKRLIIISKKNRNKK